MLHDDSKTFLKCAIARIKQSQARKTNDSKTMAKEIGALLGGRDELARIKVEHLIRNKNEQHALEIVELFCDLLLARHLLLESEPNLPVEMQESVYSVCWAATRTEVAELDGVKKQMALKYDVVRRQFYPREGETPPPQTTYVNSKLMDYLSVASPSREKVVAYLTEIAKVHAPGWEPSPEMVDDAPADAAGNLIDFTGGGGGGGGGYGGGGGGYGGGGGGAIAAPPVGSPALGPGDVTVTFTESTELGMDLTGIDHTGREASNPDVPTLCVVVTGVRPGTQAERCGQVMRGHAIKAINGRSVLGGFTLNQTLGALTAAGRPVSFVIGPPPMVSAVGGGGGGGMAMPGPPPPGYSAPGAPPPGFAAPPPGFGGGGAVPVAHVQPVPAQQDPMAMFPAVPTVVVAAAPAPAPAP